MGASLENFKNKSVALKKTVFDNRITVHPSIANAYCTLTLTHAIMTAIESGQAIVKPSADDTTNTSSTEQDLMKAFFLELMNTTLTQQDIIGSLNRYYRLAFVQNLIRNVDFQAMQSESHTDKKQEHYKKLASWLIANLNLMGLRYDRMPPGSASTFIVSNSHVLGILKDAMSSVLKTRNDRSLLHSPSWFAVVFGLTVGLFLLGITLSAMPHIVQGKGILLLLVGAYGAYLTHKNLAAIRAPAFEPNLSSQPNACNLETIVINEQSISVLPSSKAPSSYGTFWKTPEPPKQDSAMGQAKSKLAHLLSRF